MYKQSVELFASQISKIVKLSPAALQSLTDCVKAGQLAKKEYILHPGQVCDCIYYIQKGLIREYFIDEKGNDVSVWFGKENDFAVLLSSFITLRPGITGLQAMEASEVLMLKHSDLYRLYDEFHDIDRLGRVLTEQYFVASEAHSRGFRHLGALERYEDFVSKNPELLRRVSLKHIASYLGVSLETLSRLRRNQ